MCANCRVHVINFDYVFLLVPNATDVHYNFQTKKEILSYSFYVNFGGETFIFSRDVCKLQSVVNFIRDFSLVQDAADIHYNFQTEKTYSELFISCQFCW